MESNLDKALLMQLVTKIMKAEGTQEEVEAWLTLVERNTPGPTGYVTDLIFWPNKNGLGEEPTAEEIVEKALSYKPILL